MGSATFDKNGQASTVKGVLMNTVKKAVFSKSGTVRTLMKLILNGVTYDFAETAKGGKVIVGSGYETWEFIAPDGRLDFAAYAGMTWGEVMADMQTVLTDSPIPAWDEFAAWFDDKTSFADTANSIMTYCICPIGGGTRVQVSELAFGTITNFADFLSQLATSLSQASGLSMSDYMVDDNSFGCVLILVNSSGADYMTMTFLFRE